MWIIINPQTEKVLCSFVFPTEELAIKYAQKMYFSWIYKVFQMTAWDEANNNNLN